MKQTYDNATVIITQLTLDALSSARHIKETNDKIYSSNLIHLVRNLLVIVNKTEYFEEDRTAEEIFEHLNTINTTNPENLPEWVRNVLNNEQK